MSIACGGGAEAFVEAPVEAVRQVISDVTRTGDGRAALSEQGLEPVLTPGVRLVHSRARHAGSLPT